MRQTLGIFDIFIKIPNSDILIVTYACNEHTIYSFIVAVSACAIQKTYSSNEKIQFPYVHINLGVIDSVMSSMKTTGIFICERPGLYLVSSFITATTNGYYYLNKNGGTIGAGYLSLNGGAQTSTIMQLILLNANDTLSILNRISKYIYGDHHSCLSILQLTG